MKHWLSALLIFSFFCSFARTPQSPYIFHAPDLEELLPFSKDELAVFRKEKIRKLERKYKKQSFTWFLNDSGQVVQEQVGYMFKKVYQLVSTITYRYNTAGQLLVRRTSGMEPASCDSLIYDNNGRLIYYYSSNDYLNEKKKIVTNVNWELRLKSVEGDLSVLEAIDTADGSRYYLDAKNEFIKIVCVDQTDSVAIEKISSTVWQKKFYYRTPTDSAFKVGATILFANDRIRRKQTFDMYSPKRLVSEKNYLYDELGRLISITGETEFMKKILYTYDRRGLPFEIIEMDMFNKAEPVNVSHYTYFFK